MDFEKGIEKRNKDDGADARATGSEKARTPQLEKKTAVGQ